MRCHSKPLKARGGDAQTDFKCTTTYESDGYLAHNNRDMHCY
jgi:hypothetical protein